MSDIHDEKLETMLRSRRIEAAGPDLADRIILKAQRIPQRQPITLTEWANQLFSEFHLPRPAYVLACTLILGFVVGMATPVNMTTDNSDAVAMQSFLYADEDVL
jgi:hypothetical protein